MIYARSQTHNGGSFLSHQRFFELSQAAFVLASNIYYAARFPVLDDCFST